MMKFYQSCLDRISNNSRIAPFFFEEWDNHTLLLTNDLCNYSFISQEQFLALLEGKNPNDELSQKGFTISDDYECWASDHSLHYLGSHQYLARATNLFIIVLTLECELRCTYCQAKKSRDIAKHTHMTPEGAQKAAARILESPSPHLVVEFQGGEPLMNVECLSLIISEVKASAAAAGKTCSFQMTTNAQSITEEIAEYLIREEIAVTVSLDGPATLHNFNRPVKGTGRLNHSVLLGWLKYFRERHAKIHAIPTITKESLAKPERIVDAYVENGFEQIFLSPQKPLGRGTKMRYSPEEFADFYGRSLQYIVRKNDGGQRIADGLLKNIASKIWLKKAQNHMEFRSPCGAAIGQIAIDWNGSVYTCDEGRMLAQEGDSCFCLGNVDERYSQWINQALVKQVACASCLESSIPCAMCVYMPFCAICPVINVKLNQTPFLFSSQEWWCRMRKGMFRKAFEVIRERPDLVRSWIEV